MVNQTLPVAGPAAETGSLEKLQAELFPREKLLWHGRPVQGIRFVRSTFIGYGIGVILLAFVLVLLFLALSVFTMPDAFKDWRDRDPFSGARASCWVWIVGLLPVAAYCLGWGQWLDARGRGRLFYGVTNERILLVRANGRNSEALTSMRLLDVPHLSLTASEDGTGSLNFVGQATRNGHQAVGYLTSFYLIPEVRKVYTLIRSIQRGGN